MQNKRFVFGCVCVICSTITAIILKYPPEVYQVIILGLAGVYKVSQTITDMKKIEGKNENGAH